MTEQPARQRLLDAMRARTCFCGADSCQTAEPLVDAYAHQLAEQQRAYLAACGLIYTGTVDEVIDVIDPETQR